MAVISISRQVGSGGHEIALALSQKLGYRFFDRALMQKIGLEAGITKGEVVDLTAERHHTQIGEVNAMLFNAASPIALGSYEASGMGAEARAAEAVSKIMRRAFEQGDVVIEGRGSQGVLQDDPGVLHVRFVAPNEQRIEYLMKRDNITRDAARKMVKEADNAQADYIRRYFGADITDPTLYHLIINTAKVSQEKALELILKALEK
mgnify:CR=1 FL=1